ncbi:MAG: hypothetical protein AABW49_04670 [Nanoarchaeota archaeon]
MVLSKRKRWFKIISPKMFNSVELGETPSYDEKGLIGKKIKVSASDVIGDPKKQHLKLIFKIKDIKVDQANTEFSGCELVLSQVRRFARKGGEKIDDSFVIETKDKKKIRAKPVLVTKTKVPNSVLTALKANLRQYLNKEANDNSCDNFVLNIIAGKTQREIKNELKKIYPVAQCEFRKILLYQSKAAVAPVF